MIAPPRRLTGPVVRTLLDAARALTDEIETANRDPHEHVPHKIRAKTRDLALLLDIAERQWGER